MAVAPDGTTYLSVETGPVPSIVCRLDDAGGLLWSVEISGVYGLHSVALRATGGCVVLTQSDTGPALVALDADGSLAWSRTYGDIGGNYAPFALTATAGGGFAVVAWHDVVRAPIWMFKVTGTDS